jgi:hypothetical protein
MEENPEEVRLMAGVQFQGGNDMLNKIIIKSQPYGLSLSLVVVWTVVALAGGFWITVEAPPSPSNGEFKEAVAVVRALGCHNPSDATMTATAEGLVNGRRQSLPIQLTATSKGVYAIRQQWPSQGVWVLAITGEYNGHTSSVLVEFGPNGKVQVTNGKGKGRSAEGIPRKFSAGEIDAALKALANQPTRAAK